MPAPLPAYAELGARSNFSFLNGTSYPAELVATAAELGLSSIGICDTNSLAGVVRGHVAAKKLSLPFAVGACLKLHEPPRDPRRLLFLRGWGHDEEDVEQVFA